jgi:hypothetical protein
MIPKSFAEFCIEYDAALSYYQGLVVSNNGYARRTGHASEWLLYLEAEALRELQEIERYRPVTRTMYDSTDPTIIPADAEIVAYYPHAWGTDISKHEHALVVRIDNRGDHADDCHILDVEAGAANNTTAHEWVMSWHKLHPQGLDAVNGWIRKPVLYCSESALPALRTACAGLDYDIWVANWSTGTTPVAGCFAKQFTDHGPHGENYDMSAVYDDTWGHKPTTPTPPPPPPPPHPAASQAALLVWGVGPDVCSWREVHSTDGGKTWS